MHIFPEVLPLSFAAAALLFLTPIAHGQHCEHIQPGDVVINEILFHFGEGSLEFVELFNRSACSFSLDAFTLSDSRDTREPVQPGTAPLGPGDYAVFASNLDLLHSDFPGVHAYTVARWPALNNSGDAVVIRVGNQVVDSIYYSGTWGMPGRSLEKRNPHVLHHTSANWAASTHAAGATPGYENSLFLADEEGPQVEYVEQETPHVLFVHLSEAPDESAASPNHFSVSGIRPAHVEPGPVAATLRLVFADVVDGESLRIENISDQSGNAVALQIVPIARLPDPGDLIINEIMFDPETVAGHEQPEYVEILNRSEGLRSIRGLKLGEDPGPDGERPGSIITEDGMAIAPGQYGVVYSAPGPLHFGTLPPPVFSSFGEHAGTEARWLRVSTVTPRGLANAGQTVALVTAAGVVVDEVLYFPELHSLTLRELGNTRGTALERRSWSPGSDNASTWTSSTSPTGGTPGMRNTATITAPDAPNMVSRGLQVQPSPFSPDGDGREDVTVIQYRLRRPTSAVRVQVYDMDGRVVRVLRAGGIGGGEGSVVWDGRDDQMRTLRTGVYIIVLEELNAEAASIHRYRALVTVVGR